MLGNCGVGTRYEWKSRFLLTLHLQVWVLAMPSARVATPGRSDALETSIRGSNKSSRRILSDDEDSVRVAKRKQGNEDNDNDEDDSRDKKKRRKKKLKKRPPVTAVVSDKPQAPKMRALLKQKVRVSAETWFSRRS
jgi:hypothetical protein